MQMGDLGSYRFIQKDGVGIGAVMPKMAEMPISCWSYYIGVDDIDRAVGAIEAGGGKVINGPMEIPGGEFALDGIDPEGAAFGLVRSEEHTSELQSLMRISYAVFCLKKKTTRNNTTRPKSKHTTNSILKYN